MVLDGWMHGCMYGRTDRRIGFGLVDGWMIDWFAGRGDGRGGFPDRISSLRSLIGCLLSSAN